MLPPAVGHQIQFAAQVAANSAPLCVAGVRYTVTFDGEFATFSRYDGTRADGTWDTTYSWGRTNPGAKDAALYVDPSFTLPNGTAPGLDPFSVAGGVLMITARTMPPDLAAAEPGLNYISGLVTTRHSFSQAYGYFEASMKLPRGRGLWPAFWMLPELGYPRGTPNPEIDVMEVLGNDPARVYQTTHELDSGPGRQFVRTDVDSADGFHRYGVAWSPSGITFYVDGKASGTAPNVTSRPMYLLANLQVGGPGSWPGEPTGATSFPATMDVQYVRAYRSAGSC
jgi:beta-glucanase (GH16 family)